jgi:aryl-alcohol dehydrogenase-like predicted oxidoreductase
MKANKIVLGTVQFGLEYGVNNTSGKPNSETVFAILDFGYQNSLRYLDTAEAYGDSQEIIGKYHQQSNNKFDVITKFSANRKDLPENIYNRIKHNIKTLSVDYLYGYMFHSYSDFETSYEYHMDGIQRAKNKGLVQKFGVSIYTNKEFENIINCEEIDFIQLPFNLLDNASHRKDLILSAKQKGIEIHTRSVFLQGLFFKQKSSLSPKLRPLLPYLNKIEEISLKTKLSISELALNYSIQQADIDYVLLGVETLSQLESNILSLKKELSLETMQEVNEISVNEIELLNPSNWNL